MLKIVEMEDGDGNRQRPRGREPTAQANTAYEANVHNISVTETSRAEINPDLRGADQTPPTGLVRQEAHHQILQQPAGVFQLDVGAAGSVGRLLQENGVTGDFGDVDGDAEALAGEDGVHHGDILVREIPADGENEDAREQRGRRRGGELGRGRCGVVGGAGVEGHGGEERDLFVRVG